MRFDIITLFPEMFESFMASGVTRRAFDSGQVQVRLWNPRDHATGNYRRVDDRPFGGGPGMVMMAEPLWLCLQAIRTDREQNRTQAPLLFFAPHGQVLNHAVVSSWAASETGAVLLCGRYEGVDQRFIDSHVDGYISLGDFVLSGGEIPAMAFLDALESHAHDSFNPTLDGLLDCPHYTRPELWQGQSVPEALVSGHHGHIDRWRRQQSLSQTAQLRPDLIATARDQQKLTPEVEACLAATARGEPFGKTGI